MTTPHDSIKSDTSLHVSRRSLSAALHSKAYRVTLQCDLASEADRRKKFQVCVEKTAATVQASFGTGSLGQILPGGLIFLEFGPFTHMIRLKLLKDDGLVGDDELACSG